MKYHPLVSFINIGQMGRIQSIMIHGAFYLDMLLIFFFFLVCVNGIIIIGVDIIIVFFIIRYKLISVQAL